MTIASRCHVIIFAMTLLSCAHVIAQSDYRYTYKPRRTYVHADELGGGFDLTVYDMDEYVRANYWTWESREKDSNRNESVSYVLHTNFDRADHSNFLARLEEAGVRRIPKDPRPEGREYPVGTILGYGSDDDSVSHTFYALPTNAVRRRIHALTREFAAALWAEHPDGREVTTQVWEKITVPARTIDLNKLIKHAKEYVGKRVRVTGFYHSEFECSSLSAARGERGLWLNGGPRTNDTWIEAEGTYSAHFLERSDLPTGGHGGGFLGELYATTNVRPLTATEIEKRTSNQ